MNLYLNSYVYTLSYLRSFHWLDSTLFVSPIIPSIIHCTWSSELFMELNWADAHQKRRINFKIHSCMFLTRLIFLKIKDSLPILWHPLNTPSHQMCFPTTSESMEKVFLLSGEDRINGESVPSTSSPHFIFSTANSSTYTLIKVLSLLFQVNLSI